MRVAGPAAPPVTGSAVVVWCGWYTSVAGADLVIVTAMGPPCHGEAFPVWLAARTGRGWTSTAAALAGGTELAQVGKGGSVVRVFFTGPPSGPAGPVAGELADRLQAAGWAPEP